jgi:hypothetical protein
MKIGFLHGLERNPPRFAPLKKAPANVEIMQQVAGRSVSSASMFLSKINDS